MTEAAMSNTAPAKASLAAETTPATATPVKRLVPTAITLLLRAESPDAVDGFYNVDRDENSPQARWRMRGRGQELARQHGVQFTDFTPPDLARIEAVRVESVLWVRGSCP